LILAPINDGLAVPRRLFLTERGFDDVKFEVDDEPDFEKNIVIGL
jgi:hypothetical protein